MTIGMNRRRLATLLAATVAGAATCHAKVLLETGNMTTNVVATLALAQSVKPLENPYVTIGFKILTQPNAEGFGLIRFSSSPAHDDLGLSIYFTAAGEMRVLKPGAVPTIADLQNLEAGSSPAAHPFNLRVWCAATHTRIAGGSLEMVWHDVVLSPEQFSHAEVVLCGRNLQIICENQRISPVPTLFMVK